MNFNIKQLLTVCSIFITAISIAQPDRTSYLNDTDGHTREHNFDVIHIAMDLTFVPDSGKVKGTVTHTFAPLQKDIDTMYLDATNINIQSVKLDKQDVKFLADKKGVIVRFGKTLHWDEKHELTIQYEAQPRKGLYFIGWNDPNNLSRKQIWSQGQGIDNRYWIPLFDDEVDKSTTEMTVRFDKDYKVLSNGELLEEKLQKDGKTKLWHYKMTHPHSPYLIMLGIGKYDVKTSKSKSGVTINNWYYPEYPDRVEPTYCYTEQMMDFLEHETGLPYPWHAYSQIPVQDFMFGAMENTTATVYGDFYLIDKRAFLDRYYIGTNAHEMTHQWFGDYVTARNEAHHWLQESFATHYQKWFERSIFGEDHFQWNRHSELFNVLDAAKGNNNPIAHTQGGSARVYQKGSLVLDMLKYVLGKEQFDRALNHYLKAHPYSNVDTHDLEIAIQETLGINLDWFFDEWIKRGGEPHYQVSYVDVAKTGTSNRYTQFLVKQNQVQDGLVGLFKMPIVFEVHYKDGSSNSVKEWIAKEAETVSVPNTDNKDIDYVLFDPNSNIIKAVDFKKEYDELQAQATKATNMIDRYDAVAALSTYSLDKKKPLLVSIFQKEPFWAIRAEVVKQMAGKVGQLDAEQFAADPKSNVRQALVDNTDKISENQLPIFEKLLKDSSYYVEEAVLLKLCNQYPQNTQKYLDATKNDFGVGNKLRITWLEIAAGMDKAKYLPDLVEHVSNSYEFRTRGYACAALQRLNYLDDKLIGYLYDAATSSNSRLAQPALQAINFFKGQTEYKKMLKASYNSHQWTSWQDAVLKPLF